MCKKDWSLLFPEIHGEILYLLGTSHLSLWKQGCDIFTETTFWRSWACWFGNAGKHFYEPCCATWIFFYILNVKYWIQNQEELINQVVVSPFRGIFRGWINGLARNEAQQRVVQSPALGKKQPQAPGQARDWQSKASSRKGSGCPAGHEVDHEPAKCHYGQSDHQSPGCPGHRIAYRLREVIAPLCSAFERCLGAAQLWIPMHKGDRDILERVQWRVMKMIKGLKRLSHEKVGELGLCSLWCCHRIIQ